LDCNRVVRYPSFMRSFLLTAFALATVASTTLAQNLVVNGSFEQPVVTERTSAKAGGDPAAQGAELSSWASFVADEQTEGGKIEAGITNEIARTGKQSLFVDFQKVIVAGRKAILQSKMIPVKAGQAYRLSIWGRIDGKRPLALDERRPEMWLELRFFQPDQKTETGEAIAGAEFLPGDIIPGGPHPLRFMSIKWSESEAKFTAPQGAAFIRITWLWIASKEQGETDGVVYWDDASLVEATAATNPATPPPTGTAPDAQPPAPALDR
jgi:hypothetical protein